MPATRGVRLNNPLLIRIGPSKWQDKLDPSSDPEFEEFPTPVAGLRAGAVLLMNYEHKGFDTVRKIINRFAPPNGDRNGDLPGGAYTQDTSAYVRDVAARMKVNPDQVIDADDCATMLPLITAIVAHENKNFAYPERIVLAALRAAGVHNVPPEPVSATTAFKAKVAAGALTGASMIESTAHPLKSAADALEPYTGAALIGNVVTWLVGAAGLAVMVSLVTPYLRKKAGLP